MHGLSGFPFFTIEIEIMINSMTYKYSIYINTTTTIYHTIDLSITSILLEAMVNRRVTSKYHHRIKDFVV